MGKETEYISLEKLATDAWEQRKSVDEELDRIRSEKFAERAIAHIESKIDIKGKEIHIIHMAKYRTRIQIDGLIFIISDDGDSHNMKIELVKECPLCDQVYTRRFGDLAGLGEAVNASHSEYECKKESFVQQPSIGSRLEEIIREIMCDTGNEV